MNLLRKLSRALEMAKNKSKRGKSIRHGNLPSPYTKYNKAPYVYSSAYHDWRRTVMNKRSLTKENYKTSDRNAVREYKIAAE